MGSPKQHGDTKGGDYRGCRPEEPTETPECDAPPTNKVQFLVIQLKIDTHLFILMHNTVTLGGVDSLSIFKSSKPPGTKTNMS